MQAHSDVNKPNLKVRGSSSQKSSKISMKKHKVTINYGPYVSFGLLEHRTARLEGVQALLLDDGHTVNFTKSLDRNIVQIIVNGEMIYTSNIQNFQFGGDGKLDPICYQVLEAVKKAF